MPINALSDAHEHLNEILVAVKSFLFGVIILGTKVVN